MRKLYVCDTNAIIWFFSHVFGTANRLSNRSRNLLDEACHDQNSDVRLSVPAVVFIEIFEKWCTNDVAVRRIHNEVFRKLSESPNVEIRPIDLEIISCAAKIEGRLKSHEMHDKIILASAIVLECPLISADGEIAKFNNATSALPEVFS